jgi:diacylglycerol diphosphate phosphatase/phosphatidate phosphatase
MAHTQKQEATVAPNANGARGARPRFAFGHWIRLHGFDIVTLALMGALGLGIYEAPPAPNRSFPVFSRSGDIVYPEYAYPLRKEVVPIWLAAFIAFMLPFVFFVLFQIRRRSINDLLTTTLGLLKSLVTAAVFQVFLKCLIGGFRPHFLDVCKPNVPAPGSATTGNGFQNIMYTREVCTGDEKEINDSLESFPSGHSTAAFAGLVYLALYFNAQLKVMSAHSPAYWKMVVFFMPLLAATLIAGALTIDQFHHWWDVGFGSIIGTACALVAFRMTFASIWDFRFNHLLLPRTTSLFQRTPLQGGVAPFFSYAPGLDMGSSNLPVTREGGWGWSGDQEATVGAPGDATVLRNAGGMGSGAAGGMGSGMHGGYTNGHGTAYGSDAV